MTQVTPISLGESAERVAHHAAAIIKIETDAQRKTLLPRLLIGLHCLKAHHLFAPVDVSKKNKHNRNKKITPQADLTTSSYEEWLTSTNTDLKRSNTYRYMSAVCGLGCDENSTEEELTIVFKTYTNPTLALLCNANPVPLVPPAQEPQEQQLEFDLLRGCLKANRQQCEELVTSLERLKAFPELHKAACARLYDTLYKLTGVHWQPSDTEHEYAQINPDQIEL